MTAARPLAVALAGSPRRRANSTILAEHVLEELAPACEYRLLRLAEHDLLPCLAHDRCGAFAACPRPDDMSAILDVVYAADVLVLATPVYYENVSAQLKLFMDRNMFAYTHDRWLRAKHVGLIAVTAETGLDDALGAMRRYLRLSTTAMPEVTTLGVLADGAAEVLDDAAALEQAREMGRQLAAAAGLTPSG